MTYQCQECAVIFPSKDVAVCDDCTSPSKQWRWQQLMFIYSCLLHEEGYEPVLNAAEYDSLVRLLTKWYDQDCTPDFKARVNLEQSNSGAGIVFTDLERSGAIEWFERVKGRKPHNVSDL